MEKIKLLVVDDIPQTRKDIIRLLYFEDDMIVVGESGDGADALRKIGELHPDVVLMDINMPQMDGIAATERACQLYPQVAVIIISIQGESEYLKKAMVAGARDYLVKPLGSEEMAGTIRSAYKQQRMRMVNLAGAAETWTADRTGPGARWELEAPPAGYLSEAEPRRQDMRQPLPDALHYRPLQPVEYVPHAEGSRLAETVTKPDYPIAPVQPPQEHSRHEAVMSHSRPVQDAFPGPQKNGEKFTGDPYIAHQPATKEHPNLPAEKPAELTGVELQPETFYWEKEHGTKQITTQLTEHDADEEPEQDAETETPDDAEKVQGAISKLRESLNPHNMPKQEEQQEEKSVPKAQKKEEPKKEEPRKTEEPDVRDESMEKPLGFVTVVFSGKGGVGSTTIATNLAVVLAQQEKKKVALVDFDLQFGDISVLLNLSDGKNIGDLIREEEEITGQVVEDYMIRHFSGIDILPAPLFPQDAEYISADHTEQILMHLKKKYDYVVVDTACAFDEINLRAMDMAERILLVTTRDIITIKNAKTSLNILESLNYREKIRIVLNRGDQDLGVDVPDLEKGLEMTVSHQISGDEKSLVSAINKGVPVVVSQSNTEISRSFKRLSERLVHVRRSGNNEKQSRGIITRMFSL